MAQLGDFIVGAQSVKFCHTNEFSTHRRKRIECMKLNAMKKKQKYFEINA